METSDYLKDDCLIMKCTVGVVRTQLEGPKQLSVTVPPSDMGRDFRVLLDSQAGCDVVFKVGDEEYKAHKLVLAARSPVFRAQFFGLVGDPNIDKVVVEDVEPFIFKVTVLNCISHHHRSNFFISVNLSHFFVCRQCFFSFTATKFQMYTK